MQGVPNAVQIGCKNSQHDCKPALRVERNRLTLDIVGRIHAFKVDKETLLYDTSAGSLLSLDDEAYELFSRLEKGEIQASGLPQDVAEFIADGTILSPIVIPPVQDLAPKSLCLVVSHACDMACSYCSLANVTGQGKLMSKETARKALEWLVPNAPGKKIDIDFFGGEPLLAWETVKDAVTYGNQLSKTHDKQVRWSMSTNALKLDDEMLDFCDENYISLVLSLDGPKSINDSYRLLRDKSGSFDVALGKIQKVAARRDRGYYVRGTYTKKTVNFSDSVIALHKMGIPNLAFEPVVTNDPELAITLGDEQTIRTEYLKLAKYYVGCLENRIPFKYYHFELDLENGPCARKMAGGCGAGAEYLAVSPDGSIWPCHQFDGTDAFRMGNLDSPSSKSDFDGYAQKNHLINKPECLSCWAMFLCSGGCLSANNLAEGDISTPYKAGCLIQKIRLETALWIQSKISS